MASASACRSPRGSCSIKAFVVLGSLVAQISAHGHLAIPAPRQCKDGGCGGGDPPIEDNFSPINFNGDGQPESNRLPANDPANHPERQSFVCRISGPDAAAADLARRARASGALAAAACSARPRVPPSSQRRRCSSSVLAGLWVRQVRLAL